MHTARPQRKTAAKKYLEKVSGMWRVGFRYSWNKMDAVAQDRTG